jgi:tetratricopeptide (TPR) repeat protein
MEVDKSQVQSINQQIQQNQQNSFLEVSVINELIQNIDLIENKCKGNVGEDVVEMRIKQLAYAKLLKNVYNKDVSYLIKAYTQLGVAYLDINYFEQAQEHLLNAFKLNETSNDELNLSNKEYQIKILINLAKCYMENNKAPSALSICEKSLKMNQALLGENHVSNADIYYVLAKVRIKFIFHR